MSDLTSNLTVSLVFSVDEPDVSNRAMASPGLEMCPVLVCLTDVESECENVNSQSMCLSVRREQLVQLDTQSFFAVADNTKLAGERKIAKLDR